MTNRRLGVRQRLDREVRDALMQAGSPESRLQLLESNDDLDAIADILAETDRFQFLHPTRHADMVREIRWTTEEAQRTCDGLSLETLELSAADLAAMRILASRPAMDILHREASDKGSGNSLARPLPRPRRWDC